MVEEVAEEEGEAAEDRWDSDSPLNRPSLPWK